jgi:hypothetical protein
MSAGPAPSRGRFPGPERPRREPLQSPQHELTARATDRPDSNQDSDHLQRPAIAAVIIVPRLLNRSVGLTDARH